jgi:toxin ParE1/3/4
LTFDVVVIADAQRDIESIHEDIVERAGAAAADRLEHALYEACSSLLRFPNRGNVPKEMRAVGNVDFRELHVGVYRIIYQVIERSVLVHCVLDGRRDLQGLLHRRLLR